MERVGEHAVPIGPLAARWRAYSLAVARAGTLCVARVVVENAGSAVWRSRGALGIQVSSHWLDELGNAIVWDGIRNPLPHPVGPGETVELTVQARVPRPPGRYRLAFDLLDEHNFWFAEIGNLPLDVPVAVAPRIAERRLAVVVHGDDDEETTSALAGQEEPLVHEAAVAVAYLVAGAIPPPDWSRRMLDAHAEGFAAVGPALLPTDRPTRRRLGPWAPAGRNPRFGAPLLLPSLLADLEPDRHQGLPSYSGAEGLFDGRVAVRLRQRSDRRRA